MCGWFSFSTTEFLGLVRVFLTREFFMLKAASRNGVLGARELFPGATSDPFTTADRLSAVPEVGAPAPAVEKPPRKVRCRLNADRKFKLIEYLKSNREDLLARWPNTPTAHLAKDAALELGFKVDPYSLLLYAKPAGFPPKPDARKAAGERRRAEKAARELAKQEARIKAEWLAQKDAELAAARVAVAAQPDAAAADVDRVRAARVRARQQLDAVTLVVGRMARELGYAAPELEPFLAELAVELGG
jgi:hypothetical protein